MRFVWVGIVVIIIFRLSSLIYFECDEVWKIADDLYSVSDDGLYRIELTCSRIVHRRYRNLFLFSLDSEYALRISSLRNNYMKYFRHSIAISMRMPSISSLKLIIKTTDSNYFPLFQISRLIPRRNVRQMRSLWAIYPRHCRRARTRHQKCLKKHWKVYQTSRFPMGSLFTGSASNSISFSDGKTTLFVESSRWLWS